MSAFALVRAAASLPGLLREFEEEETREPGALLVTGPPSVAHRLAAELGRDGDPAFVRVLPAGGLGPEALRGAALVHVLTGRPTPTDERLLAEARQAGLYTVCLALGAGTLDAHLLGIVRAREVVSATAIDSTTVEAVAGRIAAGLEEGWLLARRLPALRRAVGRELGGRQAFAGAMHTTARTAGWQESLTADLRLGLQVAAGHGRGSDRSVALVVGTIAAAAAAGRFAFGRRGGSRLHEVVVGFAATWAAGRLAAAYVEHSGQSGAER